VGPHAGPSPFTTWCTSTVLGGGALEITVYESASGRAPTSQDAWVVSAFGDRVRLAALDGITPTSATPSTLGLDGAAWAARVAAAALEVPVPAPDALGAANAYLRSLGPADLLLRDRPHTMAAVTDLVASDAGPSASISVAGDCQVFVADHGTWGEQCGGPLLTAAVRAAWRRWHEAHRDAHPVDGVAGAYEELLADPAAWRTTPIGLFSQPRLASAELAPGAFDEVVVASDGARLTTASVANLADWLSDLRRHEAIEHAGAYKPHDDVVVVHARLGMA